MPQCLCPSLTYGADYMRCCQKKKKNTTTHTLSFFYNNSWKVTLALHHFPHQHEGLKNARMKRVWTNVCRMWLIEGWRRCLQIAQTAAVTCTMRGGELLVLNIPTMVCVANSSVPHHNVMLLEAQTCMCYWCHQYIIVSKLFNWLFILLGFIVHTASIYTHTQQQLMLQCEASLTLCARYVSNRVIAHPYHVIMSQARQASLLSTEGRPFSFLSSFLHLSLRAPGFTNPLELLFITE